MSLNQLSPDYSTSQNTFSVPNTPSQISDMSDVSTPASPAFRPRPSPIPNNIQQSPSVNVKVKTDKSHYMLLGLVIIAVLGMIGYGVYLLIDKDDKLEGWIIIGVSVALLLVTIFFGFMKKRHSVKVITS